MFAELQTKPKRDPFRKERKGFTGQTSDPFKKKKRKSDMIMCLFSFFFLPTFEHLVFDFVSLNGT
jgi:hypothetical protein